MKSYEDIAERVFRKGDEILQKRQRRTAIIKKTSFAVSGLCAAVLICFGVWKNNDIKEAVSRLPENSHIITENDSPAVTTTDFSLQTSPVATGTDIISSVSTSAETSQNKMSSENTAVSCTTALNTFYPVSTSELQTKTTDIKTNLTETEIKTIHETTQTTLSTAVFTNSTETVFLTETTTTSENTDDERSIYMKKLTSFVTSAVVLAASATPVIGHAEYNIDPSRFWAGENEIFAAMDSGELETDIDGNGIVDALDGYLLSCYCFSKGDSIDFGFNIPDETKDRIRSVADYNQDGTVDDDDMDSWARYFIINHNLKVELFDNDEYYSSEYISEESPYISDAVTRFRSDLIRNSSYLKAGYDLVSEMYENGTIDLDVNGNGQLDIGDAYQFNYETYSYHAIKGTQCEEVYQNCCSVISDGCKKENLALYATCYIVGHIELKPEYLNDEYYHDTYGCREYDSVFIRKHISDAAARMGIIPDEDEWLKYNIDDMYEFIDSYFNDVENGILPAPDVNMDGVVDYIDYFDSNIYMEDLLNDRNADESILPVYTWNNLAENCDFNGNGTSRDIYDILAVQLYVVKNAEAPESFQEAYEEYKESLGGTSELVLDSDEISYETTVNILSDIESEIVYGDANCDGYVTIADATAITQFLGNPDEYQLSWKGKRNADCYNSGDGVTGKDAAAIQALMAEVISDFSEME